MIGIQKILIITAAVLLVSSTAFAAKIPAKKASPATAAKQGKQQTEECKAYLVAEANTWKVLESSNANAKLAPASVTKLMVAYVVLDKLNRKEIQLTDKVKTTKNAAKIGGTQVYLREGEIFTLEEMMKAMLIGSANDAAYAIAEHISGSREEFVKLMNEKAKALGMTNSEFNSPHGLPPSKGDREDLVTCNDLLTLSKELLKYPKLLEWTSKVSDTFRNGEFKLNNTNKLLTRMPGIDGLKTGFYGQAGFSIVTTGKKDDLRLVTVAMGCPSGKIRDQFVINKMKSYFSQYRTISVVKKGETVDKDFILEDGKYRKIKGIANSTFVYATLFSKKGEIRKEIVTPDKIKGEIREGQKLGEMVIYFDQDIVGKVDIVSPVHVPKANLFTRLIRRLGLNL